MGRRIGASERGCRGSPVSRTASGNPTAEARRAFEGEPPWSDSIRTRLATGDGRTMKSVPGGFFSALEPLIFAHRGGSALAPENTIAAFDRSHALGVDGLEVDVHLSRDGIVVVHHDRTLDRTTSLTGSIAARMATELAAVSVPTLAEVLARYSHMRV